MGRMRPPPSAPRPPAPWRQGHRHRGGRCGAWISSATPPPRGGGERLQFLNGINAHCRVCRAIRVGRRCKAKDMMAVLESSPASSRTSPPTFIAPLAKAPKGRHGPAGQAMFPTSVDPPLRVNIRGDCSPLKNTSAELCPSLSTRSLSSRASGA